MLMEDNRYTRTLLKQLFCLIIDEKKESSSIKFKKNTRDFWNLWLFLPQHKVEKSWSL